MACRQEGNGTILFPSVLSDTEGRITSFLLKSRQGNLSVSVVKCLLLALPDVHSLVVPQFDFNASTRIGGALDEYGCRRHFDLPPFVIGRHSDFGIENEWLLVEWLNTLLPYSDLFSEVNIRWRTGIQIQLDLADLELSDRLSKSTILHKQFPELAFEVLQDGGCVWHFENQLGFIRCDSKGKLTLSDKAWQSLPSIICQYNEYVNTYQLNWDVRFCLSAEQIRSVRKIELDSGLCKCSKPHFSLNARLTSWPQDQFTVRKVNGMHLLALSPEYRSNQDATFRAYCKAMIPENESLKWSDANDSFTTQGGNIHVTENLIFIGKDELNRYSSNSDLDEASEQVKRIVFGTIEGKDVIWIGCDTLGPDLRNSTNSFQPVYHTDLFFAPFGFKKNDSDETVFQFIISFPVLVEESRQMELQELIEAFTERFTGTLRNLQQQLDKRKILYEFSIIDLPIRIDEHGRIQRYWSFANGLVNRAEEKLEFLMPSYDSDANSAVHKAQTDATVKITSLGWTVVPISGYELDGDPMGSLRCQVKVLGRE